MLETVFRAPQIADRALASPAAAHRPALTGRLLVLPLRSDLGDVSRALGCLVSDGDRGEAPRQFDLVAEMLIPVIDGGKVVEPTAFVRGFAQSAAV